MKRFIFPAVMLCIVCTLLSDEVTGSSLRNKRRAFIDEFSRCPKPTGFGTCDVRCGHGIAECPLGKICCSNGCGLRCVYPRVVEEFPFP